jgi:glycosyltransferase involved in cell wall biosynthesis
VIHQNQLVSVIVTTRNSQRTLEACLISIGRQVYPAIELIVIDNGSTDQTVTIAQRYADCVPDFAPVPWIATSAQRNLGARMASGAYLLFIDSDMRLSAEVVRDAVMTVQRTGSPGAIIPEISVGEGYWARCRALERSCYHGDDSAEAARFFRTKPFRESAGYDEELTALEDWDLSQRIAGGGSLPRIGAVIIHDEGHLRLIGAAAKKRYYGASFRRLVGKHGKRGLMRANLVARPAFFRSWRRLSHGGLATPGMFLLRAVELVAAASGALGPDGKGRFRGASILYPK